MQNFSSLHTYWSALKKHWKILILPALVTATGLVAVALRIHEILYEANPTSYPQPVLPILASGICLLVLFISTAYKTIKVNMILNSLKEREERYALAVEGSGMALWDWDTVNGKIVWAGQAWKIFGVADNAEVPNEEKDVRARIPPEDNIEINKIIYSELARGDHFIVEFRIRQTDGRIVWVQSRGKAIGRHEGNPTRIIGIFTDITELKRIEASAQQYQSRLESILDNMVDGLMTIDERGTVQSYNKACEKIFGYAPDEVIGANVKMLMPSHYAEHHDQYIRNYKDTKEAKIIGIGREVEGRRKDGTVFPIDLSVAEVPLGNQSAFSGIIRDITERKKAEDQLRRTNEELEQFAYIASHDLKAPLRGIDNLAKWIGEDLSDVLTENTQEKMDLLRGRVARLEMLLEDILQYSRAGRIVDSPVSIDTGDLIRQIADEGAVPKGFEILIPEAMPTVLTPQTPLRQVLTNLIVNAAKHHDRKTGVINIGAADYGAYYEFSISDDGPGIPPRFHERVFRMFQTLKSRDEKESSGLGLSIVKKLVEWQGGKIWIESEDGKRGTTFRFLWAKHWISEGVTKRAA